MCGDIWRPSEGNKADHVNVSFCQIRGIVTVQSCLTAMRTSYHQKIMFRFCIYFNIWKITEIYLLLPILVKFLS